MLTNAKGIKVEDEMPALGVFSFPFMVYGYAYVSFMVAVYCICFNESPQFILEKSYAS